MTPHRHASLDDWLTRDARPVDGSGGLDAVLDEVMASLDESVALLGFGEALHGGEAILTLRNRVFRRLVEAHGFSAIALENSYPHGRVANDYVLGRGPATYEAMTATGLSHGFGALEANRDLLGWMRAYNAEAAQGIQIRFYGFDIPGLTAGPASPRHALAIALGYLEAIDDAGTRALRDRFPPLLGTDAEWEDYTNWSDPAKSLAQSPRGAALRLAIEDLVLALQVSRPALVAAGGAERHAEALHAATLARQFLSFFAGLAGQPYAVSLGIRDAIMADNLAHIAERERDRGKVLVFAHNAHLQRGQVVMPMGPQTSTWWSAGAQLHAMIGSRYAVIGSAVGTSAPNGIAAPEPGTLEARLTANSDAPAVLIPTHRGEGLPQAEIAALPTRTLSALNPSYRPLTPESFTDFDWLAIVRDTPYTRGGPPLPQPGG